MSDQRRRFKLATCTHGLGRWQGGHTLDTKLAAARQAGYDGVEVTFDCLDHHARAMNPQLYVEQRSEALLNGAQSIRTLLLKHQLEAVSLQPFMNFDALRPGQKYDERLAEGKMMLGLAQALGAPLLQVASCVWPTSLDDIDPTPSQIARNMQELADLAAPLGITLAYEAPAFGMVCNRWQDIERIIAMVDRPNIKHCLDTFHIAGLLAGNPEDAANNYRRSNGMKQLELDLQELRDKVSGDKIAILQLSDAKPYRTDRQSYKIPLPSEAPFYLAWSRTCRPHPLDEEKNALLPVVPVAAAILSTGFTGWLSFECFDDDLYDTRSTLPREWAEAGSRSWQKLVAAGLSET